MTKFHSITSRENKQPSETQSKLEKGGKWRGFSPLPETSLFFSIKMNAAADRLYINASGSGDDSGRSSIWERKQIASSTRKRNFNLQYAPCVFVWISNYVPLWDMQGSTNAFSVDVYIRSLLSSFWCQVFATDLAYPLVKKCRCQFCSCDPCRFCTAVPCQFVGSKEWQKQFWNLSSVRKVNLIPILVPVDNNRQRYVCVCYLDLGHDPRKEEV